MIYPSGKRKVKKKNWNRNLFSSLFTSSEQKWNATQVLLSFADRTKPSLQTHFGIPQVRGQFGIVSGNFVQSQDASHWRVNSGQWENSSFSLQISTNQCINYYMILLHYYDLSGNQTKKKKKTK